MALILGDRVKETTATSGTGALTLGGATAGFQTFSNGVGNGNTTYYTILDSANPPTYWEVGLGTYSNLLNTLSRDTVYSSSNGNALVNIPPSSVSFVFCDYPASTAVFESKLVAGNNITITKSAANNTLTIASTGGGGGNPFTASTTGSYTVGTNLPFYNPATSSTIAWTVSSSNTPTAINVTFSDGTNSQTVAGASGTTTTQFNLGAVTISGTVSGTGSDGVARVIPQSGSIPAVARYTPSFWAQTTTSAPPAFITTSNQTAGATGVINYPLPSATTNYNWICTQKPLTSLLLQSPFGTSVLVPDVTATPQIISGQTFQVYGWSFLSTNNNSVLQVN